MNAELVSTFKDKRVPFINGSEKNALVLMSGGVDSSAAALALLRGGYNVAGLTMEILKGSGSSACDSAAEVCRALSIPHFSVDISDGFKARVLSPFCLSYTLGMTPNPCADCNEQVKFGLLWDMAEREWGAGFNVATGHYARIIKRDGRAYLARAVNLKKDQSYFLSGIPSDRVARILFPLGSFRSKDETRAAVRAAGLPVADRPESMEICFAGESDYRAVLDKPSAPGPIVDTKGTVIGTHSGISGYTLGQRKGLGIASRHPLFVTEIRPCDNTIVAAPRSGAFHHIVNAGHINILSPADIYEGADLFAKIRSQGEPASCSVLRCGTSGITVCFREPVFAPAPGQRLVIYKEDGIVAAGGVITSSEKVS